MKLAVVIDPIKSLNPKKDSTVAMLRAAQNLGLEIFFMTQQDLFVDNGIPYANISQIEVNACNEAWFQILKTTIQPLSSLDIILMRKDPPFNMNYIYTTYILELAEKEGVLVANKPQSLRDANEKVFCTHFKALCAPTFIGQNIEQLKAFWQTHQDVIFKPLDGMGGRSIFHVDAKGQNINVILDSLTHNQTMPIMAQAYIPEIKTTGDKRILIVNDYVVPFALARIPQGDDERGNLAKGAKGEVVALTDHQLELAQQVVPTLQAKGLKFVGLDMIGDFITEINVTSPTCIVEIEKGSNEKIAERFIKHLISVQR